jgi:hypothetical protein
MRFRLDSDVAVFIGGDYGGPPPIEGVTQTWVNASEWEGKTKKQKLALIKRVRAAEAALSRIVLQS